MNRRTTPEAALETFAAAGYDATRERWRGKSPQNSGMIRVRFTSGSGKTASLWFSCKSGRWLRNRRWSSEFGPRGASACCDLIKRL